MISKSHELILAKSYKETYLQEKYDFNLLKKRKANSMEESIVNQSDENDKEEKEVKKLKFENYSPSIWTKKNSEDNKSIFVNIGENAKIFSLEITVFTQNVILINLQGDELFLSSINPKAKYGAFGHCGRKEELDEILNIVDQKDTIYPRQILLDMKRKIGCMTPEVTYKIFKPMFENCIYAEDFAERHDKEYYTYFVYCKYLFEEKNSYQPHIFKNIYKSKHYPPEFVAETRFLNFHVTMNLKSHYANYKDYMRKILKHLLLSPKTEEVKMLRKKIFWEYITGDSTIDIEVDNSPSSMLRICEFLAENTFED